MHCNQPFCGNGYSNDQCLNQYGFNASAPPQNSGPCPEIVGEGEVTSVRLADGTVQFFFIPTIKWWAPHTPNMYPFYNNMASPNPSYHYYGTNIGVWFVRTITNPGSYINPQQSIPRHDLARPNNWSENNLHPGNSGHQLKFHHDKWTSTTHLQYFFPCMPTTDCMPAMDCSISLPSRGCAAVQVDTPMAQNTVYYEVACSKPCCNCVAKPCCCKTDKRSSAMSLVDDSSIGSQGSLCECSSQPKKAKKQKVRYTRAKNKKSHSKLQRNEPKTKRIRVENELKTESLLSLCRNCCGPDKHKANKPNLQCSCDAKTQNKPATQKENPKQTQKVDEDISCECSGGADKNKSVTSYTDRGCGSDCNRTVETQCCRGRDATDTENEAELWSPKDELTSQFFKNPKINKRLEKASKGKELKRKESKGKELKQKESPKGKELEDKSCCNCCFKNKNN